MLWPVRSRLAEFDASDGGRRRLQNQFSTLDSHRFKPAMAEAAHGIDKLTFGGTQIAH
jgi:hypothetical protein